MCVKVYFVCEVFATGRLLVTPTRRVDGLCIKMPHVAPLWVKRYYKRHFGILIENCDHISPGTALNTGNYFNVGNKENRYL